MVLRGLIVASDLSYEGSASEAGAEAAPAGAVAATSATLTTSGEPTGDLVVEVLAAGVGSAGVGWSVDGGDVVGWARCDSVSAVEYLANPSVATVGGVVVLGEAVVAAVVWQDNVRIYRQAAQGAAWTYANLTTTGASHAALCRLGASLLCVYWEDMQLSASMSEDGGATWRRVATEIAGAGTQSPGRLQVVEARGGLIVLMESGAGTMRYAADGVGPLSWVETLAEVGLSLSVLPSGEAAIVSRDIQMRRLASPWAILGAEEAVAIGSGYDVIASSGALVLAASSAVASCVATIDGARVSLPSLRLAQAAIAQVGGGVLVVYVPSDSVAICALRLGGWSSAPLGTTNGIWLPTLALRLDGWSASGTASTTLYPWGEVATAYSSFWRYDTTITTSITVHARLTEGGEVYAHLDDDALKSRVRVALGASSVVVTDLAGVTRATVPRLGADVEIQAWIERGAAFDAAEVWQRLPGSPHWSLVWRTALLSRQASPGTSSSMVGVVLAEDAMICWVAWSRSRPSEAQGYLLGAHPVSLARGWCASLAGSAVIGDSWRLTPRYQYGAANLEKPSPRQAWRSTDTSTQELVWEIVGGARGPILGLHLARCNLRAAAVYLEVEGQWWMAYTLDFRRGLLLPAKRGQRTVVPDGASNLDMFKHLPENALAGGTIAYTSNGVTHYARIERQTAGGWSGVDVDVAIHATLPATAGAEGHAELWSPCASLLLPVAGEVTRVKLVIPSGSNADGFWSVGTVVIGRFYALGDFPMQVSSRHARTYTMPGEEVSPRGSEPRRRSRGPMYQEISLAWPDGIDTSSLWQAEAAALHAFLAPARGVGSAATIPWSLPHVLDATRGEEGEEGRPVVWVGGVTTSLTAAVELRRDGHLLARVASDTVSVETVMGDEGLDELVRVSTVTLREVL